MQRVGVSRFTRPKVVICVPSAITEVERRAVTDAARRAGAADANLIEQPMAAAIGADLPIDEPVGNMVIDIGGGTSETAVISLGGIVALEAVRVGSFDIDAAIQNYVRREHGIAIGERTAEEIKVAIGSADPTEDENQAEVRGRDLMTGLPKTVLLTPEEIRFAIDDVVSSIIASVVRCLAKAPPELAQDFLVRGMYLVGGGGLLRGLAQRIERETQVPVQAVERAARGRRARRRPLHRALRGAQGHVHGRPPLSRSDAGTGRRCRPWRSTPGCERIREQFGRPGGVPARGALAAAEAAAARPGPAHVDRTDRPFVTLDPAGSTDLDQAFAIERAGDDIVLHYAIADVGFFVDPGDAARRRGVAARRHGLPARRAGPAVPAGAVGGRRQPAARRAAPGRRVHRARRPRRRRRARRRRAGARPQPGQARLRHRPAEPTCPPGSPSWPGASPPPRSAAARRASSSPSRSSTDGRRPLGAALRPPARERGRNAGHVAGHEPGRRRRAARRRHRAVPGDGRPDEGAVRRLRHTAARVRARLAGRRSRSPTSSGRCRRDDPRAAAFLIAVRRAGGGATLRAVPPRRDAVALGDGRDLRPRHRAAAPAGRPLRRSRRRSPSPTAGRCPTRSRRRSTSCRRRWPRASRWPTASSAAVIDLAEAVLLSGREGEVFDAVVVDEDQRGVVVQLVDPAVLARVGAHRVDPGDAVRVKLTAVDTVRARSSSPASVDTGTT